MTPQEEKEEQEGFIWAVDGLPPENIRNKMTVVELAEILTKCKDSSLAHIVISHELNMKIAKQQSKATLSAGWIGAGGAAVASIISAYLGFLLGTAQPCKPNNAPENKKPAHATQNCPYKNMTCPIQKPVLPIHIERLVPQVNINTDNDGKNGKPNNK
jgi:hypothetical protein